MKHCEDIKLRTEIDLAEMELASPIENIIDAIIHFACSNTGAQTDFEL